MKYIRKKVIKGREYYYFEYTINTTKKRFHFTRYIGLEIPPNIKEKIKEYFSEIHLLLVDDVSQEAKKYFPPEGIKTIEKWRTEYTCIQHELYETEMNLFRTLFTILFVLNSNRAEGSQVTRDEIEKIIKRKIKPKTLIDKEIIGSLEAFNFATSKKMHWTTAAIKRIHELLMKDLQSEIAGKYKKRNNVVGDPSRGNIVTTTAWQEVPFAMKKLIAWFEESKKKTIYPPILALEFHWRFEAIHPFQDGNGRIGRILLNAYLIEKGFMPVIYFSQNHKAYCNALAKAREGKKMPLATHFINSVKKTYSSVEEYKKEGIIRGGSPAVKQWEIQKDRIRIY